MHNKIKRVEIVQKQADIARLSVKELEHRLMQQSQAIWETVNALLDFATLTQYSEDQFNKLALIARTGMELVQGIESAADITEEWRERRRVFIDQIMRIIDDEQVLALHLQEKEHRIS